jgi:glycosyltransferase involved in cell wall biosynthesis
VKHVLLAVPRMIFPAVSGGEIRVLSLLKGLMPKYRFTLVTFLESGKEHDATAAAMYLESLGVRTILVRRGPPAPRSRWAPDMARSFQDAAMEAALRRAVAEDGIDLVHLEFSQMAQYAPALRGLVPLVVTEHDTSLLSGRRSYIREAPTLFDRFAAAAYLRRTLSVCDRVVTMSDADARRLGWLISRGRVRVVPTGVDLRAFPFAPLDGRVRGQVAFVGHYAHYPNEDAALFFCGEVLPELRRRAPQAKALLIGSGLTPAVEALRSDSVELTGQVPAVAPLLSRARAFIAPMRLGYGIKGKLLEAFACGTPSVATPQACEAMPGLVDGEHVLLAEGPAALAEACARLLTDDALSARLAKAARAYVEERFGWDRQADLLDAVYREALERR